VRRRSTGDQRCREDVGAQSQLGLVLAAHDTDPRCRVDDHVGLRARDGRLGHAVVREVAVAAFERVDLVGSIAVTKLVDQRSADEAGCSRDQDIHGRRVYWRACALLASVLLAGGCDEGKHNTPPPPAQEQSFLALDAQHQRLVADYQPVSRALAAYELDPRAQRTRLARTVVVALARVRRDAATGETARAKAGLVAALEARRQALAELPGSTPYREDWNHSVVEARRALTILQDIRDRARLIPLPEDSIS
jgi:hypothetical protein